MSAVDQAMTVVEREAELRERLAAVRADGRKIGLVPTMGALHSGHLSLVEAARSETDFVAVTIFVNPTQFGPNEDYTRYPRPIDSDLQACREAGVDLVFVPSAEAMYPPGFSSFVEVEGLSARLEGEHRPTHFRGVTTVVMKLFQLTQPDVAFFGLKDYQQQLLIRRMCRDLNVPVEVRSCPIVRDEDGLAVSSRNEYLSAAERRSALSLSQSLQLAEDRLRRGETDLAELCGAMRRQMEASPGVAVDYATIVDPETLQKLDSPQPQMVALVAARVGNTRLIDNRLMTR